MNHHGALLPILAFCFILCSIIEHSNGEETMNLTLNVLKGGKTSKTFRSGVTGDGISLEVHVKGAKLNVNGTAEGGSAPSNSTAPTNATIVVAPKTTQKPAPKAAEKTAKIPKPAVKTAKATFPAKGSLITAAPAGSTAANATKEAGKPDAAAKSKDAKQASRADAAKQPAPAETSGASDVSSISSVMVFFCIALSSVVLSNQEISSVQ